MPRRNGLDRVFYPFVWSNVSDHRVDPEPPPQPDPLKSKPIQEEPPPFRLALQWVARMSTIVSEMVLPALVGQWCDTRWGTRYVALTGLVLGVTVGMWHLFQVAREFK